MVAVDVRSVDRITYNVECKNWIVSIPPSVVHSFTAVTHETGANIGFVVSTCGPLVSGGAVCEEYKYYRLTYFELQQRYFEAWW